MDKGIRQGVKIEFNRLLPTWREMGGKLPGTNFRKAVLNWAVENYGITVASACTHYNFALLEAKQATPELTEGLGRPEGKKGGRKKKVAAAAPQVDLLANMLKARPAPEMAAQADEDLVGDAVAAAAGAIPNVDGVDQVPNASDEQVEEKTYTVTRAKDGVVIVSGVTKAEAEALVEKAAAAKKAKLVFA